MPSDTYPSPTENAADVTSETISGADSGPLISIVLPAYNEEVLLERSVDGLVERLRDAIEDEFEVLLVENGSTDRTPQIAASLASRYPQVRVETLPQPSYGQALRHGLSCARGRDVLIFYVDFWNVAFLQRAVGYLTYYELVIGSKVLLGARDLRPWYRRVITRGYNLALRVFFGYPGTDAHGIKAFRRESMQPVVDQCTTDGEAFDTEMVMRSLRWGLRYRELPVEVREWRPTRYPTWDRIVRAVGDLLTLRKVLAQGSGPPEELLEEERM
jgi:glycosyltransferase AglD